MSYHIIIRDGDGRTYLARVIDDLHEAQEKLALMVEAASKPNILFAQPVWESIDLYRVEKISSTPARLREDLE